MYSKLLSGLFLAENSEGLPFAWYTQKGGSYIRSAEGMSFTHLYSKREWTGIRAMGGGKVQRKQKKLIPKSFNSSKYFCGTQPEI